MLLAIVPGVFILALLCGTLAAMWLSLPGLLLWLASVLLLGAVLGRMLADD